MVHGKADAGRRVSRPYTIAAEGGRGDALFGDSLDQVARAYGRTLIGDAYPSAYLEFPLKGEPGVDLLSVYGHVEPGARFAPGAGYGYQPMLDWFSGACGQQEGYRETLKEGADTT